MQFCKNFVHRALDEASLIIVHRKEPYACAVNDGVDAAKEDHPQPARGVAEHHDQRACNGGDDQTFAHGDDLAPEIGNVDLRLFVVVDVHHNARAQDDDQECGKCDAKGTERLGKGDGNADVYHAKTKVEQRAEFMQVLCLQNGDAKVLGTVDDVGDKQQHRAK